MRFFIGVENLENNKVRILEQTIISLENVELLLTIDNKKNYSNIKKLEKLLKNTAELFQYKLIWEDKPDLNDLDDIAQKFIRFNRLEDLELLNEISGKIIQTIDISKQFNEIVIDPEERDKLDIREIVMFKNALDKFSTLDKEYKGIEQQKRNIDKINKSLLDSKDRANSIIEDLQDKVEFLNQKTDESSNTQIKKLYMDIYDTEIKLANDYRNWALSIFALISLMLVWKFFNFGFEFNNWGINVSIPTKKIEWKSALNILLLIGLSTPAWYLARESSKHRKVAYKAQMLGTELASFPLYVRELKDEDRLDLRKHLADRFLAKNFLMTRKMHQALTVL